MVDDLLGIALLHNEATIHEDHLISYVTGKRHLMGYDDHGGFLLGKAADDLQNLAGQLRIQCGGRLVKAENVRMQRQCAGNGYPLLLTAGELVGIVICPVGKPHLRQKIHTGGTDGFLAFACVLGHQLPCQRHVFQRRVLGKEIEGLEHHAEVETLLPNFRFRLGRALRSVKQHFVLYGDGAGVRRFQKIQTTQQGGFAAAGGADDGKGLPLLQREADVIEDLRIFKMLFQMLYG